MSGTEAGAPKAASASTASTGVPIEAKTTGMAGAASTLGETRAAGGTENEPAMPAGKTGGSPGEAEAATRGMTALGRIESATAQRVSMDCFHRPERWVEQKEHPPKQGWRGKENKGGRCVIRGQSP